LKVKTFIKKYIIPNIKVFIFVGIIVGSIFLVKWWGFRGLTGFITGSVISLVLLMKRNDHFLMLYKLIDGDPEYTKMLLGTEKVSEVNMDNDLYERKK